MFLCDYMNREREMERSVPWNCKYGFPVFVLFCFESSCGGHWKETKTEKVTQ